jgi:hypothetical protein
MNFEEFKFNNNTPSNPDDDITFTVDDQKNAWDAYIEQDDYLKENRGKYAERGAVFMPMVFRADFSIIQDFYTELFSKKNTLQFRIDILNFTNLLSKDWGVGDVFVSTQPLIFSKVDADGKPLYKLRNIGSKLIDKTYEPSASINDVFRIQLGIRYMFN